MPERTIVCNTAAGGGGWRRAVSEACSQAGAHLQPAALSTTLPNDHRSDRKPQPRVKSELGRVPNRTSRVPCRLGGAGLPEDSKCI